MRARCRRITFSSRHWRISFVGRSSEGVTDGESSQAQKYLERADFLVKSPGILGTPPLAEGRPLGNQCGGRADLACSFIKTPLIVVTGTNGKTTTVGWLEEALRRAGVRVGCGGNTGTPVSAWWEKASIGEVFDSRIEFVSTRAHPLPSS